MTQTEHCFFSLLQNGLLDKSIVKDAFAQVVDWNLLFQMARKQSVLGIVFDGISALSKEQQPPKALMLQWYGIVLQVERGNQRLNKGLEDVVKLYRSEGIEPMLLKGQGVAQYYINPLHRQSGDIDLYACESYEKANELMKRSGAIAYPDTSYHRAFEWNGVEVENHRVFVDFYSKKNRHRVEYWVVKQCGYKKDTLAFDGFSVDVPAPQTNAIYLFLHIFHHFLQAGIGLRQLCDWVRLLTVKHDEIDQEQFRRDLEYLPIRRGACAFAYVAVNYLGMAPEMFPLDLTTKQARRDGEFVLRDILAMGNFGKDTVMMKSFFEGGTLGKLCGACLAMLRYMRIFKLCPSEVAAYPVNWAKRKVFKRY